jgi:uncharacterized protein (DUF433 family)
MVTTEATASDATVPVDIGSLIARSPEVKSGRPYITGTGVMVLRIAGWYKLGWSPEETARRVDLTLAQVYAALAYYHANYEEIEQQIAEEQALYEQGMREYQEKLSERKA